MPPAWWWCEWWWSEAGARWRHSAMPRWPRFLSRQSSQRVASGSAQGQFSLFSGEEYSRNLLPTEKRVPAGSVAGSMRKALRVRSSACTLRGSLQWLLPRRLRRSSAERSAMCSFRWLLTMVIARKSSKAAEARSTACSSRRRSRAATAAAPGESALMLPLLSKASRQDLSATSRSSRRAWSTGASPDSLLTMPRSDSYAEFAFGSSFMYGFALASRRCTLSCSCFCCDENLSCASCGSSGNWVAISWSRPRHFLTALPMIGPQCSGRAPFRSWSTVCSAAFSSISMAWNCCTCAASSGVNLSSHSRNSSRGFGGGDSTRVQAEPPNMP
mmetsp:Transcript_43770/g.113004  ORF Transcript_43770/g.113004 Transcript_43770/m.113004 type:complete len:329 (-) Transcript_43770:116-1102(-)